jgi:hypothetical protein
VFEYKREILTCELAEEFEPLARKHFNEVRHDWGGSFDYDPNRNTFLGMEQRNKLRFYTCRKDGELIGYACYLLLHSIQSKTQLQGYCEMIFIKKEERGAGLEFIFWCDAQIEKEVDIIIYAVKPFADYSRILKHLGHELLETSYARRTSGIQSRRTNK